MVLTLVVIASNQIKRLKEGDGFLTEKLDVANEMNNFFVNQPKDLLHEHDLGRVPDPESIDPNSLSRESALNIPYITNKEVAELLVSIPPHKATGDDGISAKLLRIAANSISNSLRRLINHCIEKGWNKLRLKSFWGLSLMTN